MISNEKIFDSALFEIKYNFDFSLFVIAISIESKLNEKLREKIIHKNQIDDQMNEVEIKPKQQKQKKKSTRSTEC